MVNDKPVKIFVIEDDPSYVKFMLYTLNLNPDHEVKEFQSGRDFLDCIHEKPDLITLDYSLPDISGEDLMCKIKDFDPSIPVIVISAQEKVGTAVKLLKLGAYDYLSKPFKPEEILLLIQRIEELVQIRQENKRLNAEIKKNYDFSSYVGDFESNSELFNLLKIAAGAEAAVLITGETGTGKELLTNIIHYNSMRSKQPLIKVSCAILSRDLFESELFGHVKGAFTGADTEKQGRFELASGGTLYLDDIDDIPLDLQVKLLRALEQREIERVGSSKSIPVDIRLIASTKKDLRKMVDEGKFREDLYYRLNVVNIRIPVLDRRREDIPLLVAHFLERQRSRIALRPPRMTAEAMEALRRHSWPGNVRELEHAVERAVLLAESEWIEPADLAVRKPTSESASELEQMTLDEAEAYLIRRAFDRNAGNVSQAAAELGLSRSALYRRIQRHGITP